jgi:hypothetical protein
MNKSKISTVNLQVYNARLVIAKLLIIIKSIMI